MRWRRRRALIPITLVAVLVIALDVAASAATPSPDLGVADQKTAGFATPEEAVREYLAGVADADAERILAASAIDEAAAGFDFAANVEALRAFLPFQSLAPSEYPFYVEANRAQHTYRILLWVQNLAYGLMTGLELDGAGIAPVDRAWAEAFVAEVDPTRLADLEVIDVRFPNAEFEFDERYLENAAAQAARYSADELTERLALVSFEGGHYAVGFTLLRFGDGWKVFSQVSPLAGTSAMGTATPTTAEDFEAGTSGE